MDVRVADTGVDRDLMPDVRTLAPESPTAPAIPLTARQSADEQALLVPAGGIDWREVGADGMTRAERRALRREEMAIARSFAHGGKWVYVWTAVACIALWVSFFPLAIMGWLNLPLAFVISCVIATGGYVTSHEAMHSNIGRVNEKTRWANELTGLISTIPIVFPFSMARLMHLEHHYHLNDPLKDSDYPDTANGPIHAWYKTWWNRQPRVDGSIHHYKRILAEMDTPEARRALKETALLQLFFMATLFTMAWTGHAIAAALIWWLPRHVGLSWIRYHLSWAPHHPRDTTDRYQNTRIYKSTVGHVLSMCGETHLIHHMYPYIPHHRTKAAYYAMRHILVKRGVDCSALPARAGDA